MVPTGIIFLDRLGGILLDSKTGCFAWAFMTQIGLAPKELVTGGKQRRAVKARIVLCYWGTRELGMSAVGISKELNTASSTASESVTRGRQIVDEQGLVLGGTGIGILSQSQAVSMHL